MNQKSFVKGLRGAAAALLSLSMLTGCAANPNQGVVTGKNDGVFESNLTTPATAPLDERIQISESFTSLDDTAEYTLSLDQALFSDPLPIVEVVPHFFTGEDVKRVAQVLFGDADFSEGQPWENPQYSKSQLQDRIQFLSRFTTTQAMQELYGGEGDYAEEIELAQFYIQLYTTQLETAPEANPQKICDWTFKSDALYTEPSYGNQVLYATLDLGDVNYKIHTTRRDKNDYVQNSLSVQLGTGSDFCDQLQMYAFRARLSRTEKPTQAQIDAVTEKAKTMLDQMDLGDWAICAAEVLTEQKGAATEYEIHVKAVPVLNGIPAIYGQPGGNLTSSDTYGSNYQMTFAHFIFSANGDLIFFELCSPIDVQTVVNENAAILSMEQLLEKARNQLSLNGAAAGVGLPYGIYDIRYEVFGEDITCKVSIDKMDFGLARVNVPDRDFTYYYVPALVLYGAADYYGKDSGTWFQNWSVSKQDLVWINAVDGSIINFG